MNFRRTTHKVLAGILLFCRTGAGQVFEVATIKQSGGTPSRIQVSGGPGTSSPGRYVCTSCPLAFLIRSAYGVDKDQIAGPSWIDAELYDVMANLPRNASQAEFRKMLQSLLAERVGLHVRSTTKVVSGYNLLVAAGRVKLKRSASRGDADVNAALRAPQTKDAEGFPVLPRGFDGPLYASVPEPTRWLMYFRADETMDKLCAFLAKAIKAPVRDRTGLKDKYEIRLTYEVGLSEIRLNGELLAAPGSPGSGADEPQMTVSTLGSSLERRLGLKLIPAKTDVEMIVIDHVDRKPAAN